MSGSGLQEFAYIYINFWSRHNSHLDKKNVSIGRSISAAFINIEVDALKVYYGLEIPLTLMMIHIMGVVKTYNPRGLFLMGDSVQ